MIELAHVTKTYRGQQTPVTALDDVSLSMGEAEFVAVRGPSGCGKSTLLSLIAGLDTPTAGRVIVDGVDLTRASSAARAAFRAERVGFVFQLFHLLPYLSVLDNVLAGAARGASARPRAVELLERFQLGHRLRHRPAELSIGERQRTAMARALINEPRLILADEPTGNLDPENAATVLEGLHQFQAAGGTVLMVTHDDAASSSARRTIHLRAGRLVSEAAVTTTADA